MIKVLTLHWVAALDDSCDIPELTVSDRCHIGHKNRMKDPENATDGII